MQPSVVAIVAFSKVQPLDVVGPFEVFASANRVADALRAGGRRYRPVLASVGAPLVVRGESGLGLLADERLGDLPSIDTLIVPGGDGVDAAARDAATVAAVRAAGQPRPSDRLGVHRHVPRRRRRAAQRRADASPPTGPGPARSPGTTPTLVVDPDPIYVRDGERVDVGRRHRRHRPGLALVEDDHGAEVAQIVARWLVVFLRRPGGQTPVRRAGLVASRHSARRSAPPRI